MARYPVIIIIICYDDPTRKMIHFLINDSTEEVPSPESIRQVYWRMVCSMRNTRYAGCDS